MFTGLVENTAILKKRSISSGHGKLTLECAKAFNAPEIGESIAVNGVCLTLEKVHSPRLLEFHVLAETFHRTNLGTLNIGAKLNLERALASGARLGGHFVTGHIDAVGRIIELRDNGEDVVIKISTLEELTAYLVPKGSIAIDGISLTLVECTEDYFTVHLIPLTLRETALGDRAGKEKTVNLESDIIGKYVHNQLTNILQKKKNINMETLRNAGFQ